MRSLLTGMCLVLLGGCQSGPGNWEPIIDTQGVDMNQYYSDLADCQGFATDSSVAAGTGRGAAGGAILGGAIGGIAGDSSESAARGAGIGAVAGGARGARSAMNERNMIIRNCLLGRGYRVLN